MIRQATARSPRHRAERRVGATLQKWTLDALLGVGGMAAVYAATHKNRSRVALKVLHRELASNQDIRDRFLREAYVANSVGHPGAVQVLDDAVSEEDEPFLIMELLDGRSLEALQNERGTLPTDEVLGYADQILDVLAVAHERGIVHRDIKPQNVFLTNEGRIKVLDFGVARILDGTASATVTGSLLGTPAFMPPEQAAGRTSEVCAASDLWSVGATMFSLLSGCFVHEAENAQAHTVKAAVVHARSLASVLPGAPPAVVRLVDRALAFEIAQRWPDARSMQQAVRAAFSPPARRASLPAVVPDEGSGEPEEDTEDEEETRAYSGKAVRAAMAIRPAAPVALAAPSRPAAPAPADLVSGARTRGGEHDDEDSEETQTMQGQRAIALVDAYGRAPAGPPRPVDVPTLAPRSPAAPMPAARSFAREDATTSVVMVDPAKVPAARISSPGAPLPPPPPPPPPLPSILGETDRMPVLAAPPPTGSQTLALGSALPPEPSSGISRMPSWTGRGDPLDPLKTEPLLPPLLPAASSPVVQPPPELRSPSQPRLSAPSFPSLPEAISVGAQSISQATSPHKPARRRMGRLEMGAIAGAGLAILLVAILVVRAVLMEGTPEPASSETPGIPSIQAPVPAPEPPGAASAAPSPTQASSAEPATPPSSASPTSAPSATASAAPSPAPVPAWRPPRDPGDKGAWKPKVKPAAGKR